MLFKKLACLPGLAFFRRSLIFFQKLSANYVAASILTPKGKNCSTASEVNDWFATNRNDIGVELQSLYESKATYVRCFEVIYTTQQNAILKPG